jgi:hypothetical protein
MLLALATLAFFPIGVLAQADPLAPKPARETPLKVGDRVVIPFGTEPRASKDADDDLKLRPPAPGDQRNAFRVYRIEKLEPEWLWIQAEHDGTAGWIARDDATPIEKAFERATNEILANPENPSVFINRALLWAEKGELDLAIADYDAAIRLDPGSPTAFNNRGTLWRRKKNTDRAESPGDSKTLTAPSPTIPRRSGLIPTTSSHSTIAAIRTARKRSSTAPSPISPRRFASNHVMRSPMPIAAWFIASRMTISAHLTTTPRPFISTPSTRLR